MKLQKYIYLIFLIAGQYLSVVAQAPQNPFELTPRLPEVEVEADNDEVSETPEPEVEVNPFDIVKDNPSPQKEQKKTLKVPKKEAPAPPVAEASEKPSILFPVLLTVLILATILLTLFRTYISRIYQAVFSDNMLHQLYNDRLNTGLSTAFIPLYLFFFLNVGLFTFLALNHFEQLPMAPSFRTLLIISGGALVIFLLKHLALIYLGRVFPVMDEVSNYNFTIVVFSIFIGIGLVPLNLGIAYVPDSMTKWLIFTTFVFIGLTYLLRYLRGIFIADKYIRFHKFHFLLYICTVEIAPVLFLYRFFTNHMQG